MYIGQDDFARGWDLATAQLGDKYSPPVLYAVITNFFRNDVDCSEEHFIAEIDEAAEELNEIMLDQEKLAAILNKQIHEVSAECRLTTATDSCKLNT